MTKKNQSQAIRIKILLAIDSAFFLVELIAGYYAGSLALVADSFHLLNDVCSLIVALYAMNLATNSKRSHQYSYGWQRAEILGALINGVFLLALCFSIFLEAIQRTFQPPEILNPRMIMIVGSFGLASNIVGLLLFHEHGHAHGAGHSHSHSKPPLSLESESSSPHHSHPAHQHPVIAHTDDERTPLLTTSAPNPSNVESQTLTDSHSSCGLSPSSSPPRQHSTEQSPADQICVHPAQARSNILRAVERGREGHSRHHSLHQPSEHELSARLSPLYPMNQTSTDSLVDHSHQHHSHSHPHSHSHSHSHMNMRAIFLHALGDALGNVGVILTGLLIWLVPHSSDSGSSHNNQWVLYADPLISLVITAIIFTSALPLVRSTSSILLQGTPSHVDPGRVQESILAIEGVRQVHELHIWSLSESKLVASVHILIDKQEEFVTISRQIRRCLHQYGIHSSTIQPEVLREEHLHQIRSKLSPSNCGSPPASSQTMLNPPHRPLSIKQKVKSLLLSRQSSAENHHVAPVIQNISTEDGCLIQCDEACDQEACCPPGSITTLPTTPRSVP